MKPHKHPMLALAGAFALVVATLGGVNPGGQSAYAQVAKLKAASFLPRRIIYAKFFYRWVRQVNKSCRGKVNITVVGPAAIKSFEQWNAVKNGVVDMHYGPAAYYAGAMPEGDVAGISDVPPSVMRKNGARKLMVAQYKKRLNVYYLTHIINGVRFYIYTTKPAKNGRFDGFRLRSVPTYDDFFKSLGAQTIRTDGPAVYTALERKTVDGLGWPLWSVHQFGWTKFIKYRYGPGFFSASVNILVNLDRWNKLTKAQRGCLTKMALWLEGEWPSWRKGQDAKSAANQKRAGVKYFDLGPDFKKLAHETYWARLRKGDPAFVDKIRPLVSNK